MSEAAPPKLRQSSASALLLIMGGCWGLQFAMLKLAAGGGYSDLAVLVLAMALLSVVFLAMLVVRRQLFRLTRERLAFLVVTSVLGYVAPLWAALYAASHLPAGILTLMASLTPVATVAIALALRTEVVSAQRVFAVVLGAIAVCLVLWPELELPGFGALHWLLIALIMPLCYGVESIYIARFWPAGLTPLQAVTGESVMAAVLVLPLFAFTGGTMPWPSDWGAAELAIGLFVAAGVLESLIYFLLIQRTGGVFVTFGGFVSLFAGIGWGIVLFSESHGPQVWAAVGILCLSLLLACWQRSDEPAD